MNGIKKTSLEVIMAVLPVTIVVFLLQLTIMRIPWVEFSQFIVGVVMVSAGLILFLLGVHYGLLPVGELIGSVLPKQGKIWMVVFFGFLFGFVVTMAEPDVRVLAMQVEMVSGGGITRNILIVAVAIGVAFFVGVSMIRIIFNIPLTYILAVGYAIVFLLASFTPTNFIPISFDAGGVTTGPLTVPFVLALGVSVASVMGGRTASADGFGLIALASIGPILTVMLLGVFLG